MRKFTAALLVAACLTVPAKAEVVDTSDDGFITRAAVAVDAEPREVWLALISPGKWWSSAHSWSGDAANMSIVPQAGGCFCERIPGEDDGDTPSLDGSAHHMTVVQASPDRVLRMRGGLGPLQSEPVEGVLTITIAPQDEGGSRILWEYVVGGYMRYEVPVISKAVDGVMTQQLVGLARFLGPLDVSDDGEEAPDEAEAEADAGADDAEEEDTSGIEEFDPGESDLSEDEGEQSEGAESDDADVEEEEPTISVDDAFGDFKLEEPGT